MDGIMDTSSDGDYGWHNDWHKHGWHKGWHNRSGHSGWHKMALSRVPVQQEGVLVTLLCCFACYYVVAASSSEFSPTTITATASDTTNKRPSSSASTTSLTPSVIFSFIYPSISSTSFFNSSASSTSSFITFLISPLSSISSSPTSFIYSIFSSPASYIYSFISPNISSSGSSFIYSFISSISSSSAFYSTSSLSSFISSNISSASFISSFHSSSTSTVVLLLWLVRLGAGADVRARVWEQCDTVYEYYDSVFGICMPCEILCARGRETHRACLDLCPKYYSRHHILPFLTSPPTTKPPTSTITASQDNTGRTEEIREIYVSEGMIAYITLSLILIICLLCIICIVQRKNKKKGRRGGGRKKNETRSGRDIEMAIPEEEDTPVQLESPMTQETSFTSRLSTSSLLPSLSRPREITTIAEVSESPPHVPRLPSREGTGSAKSEERRSADTQEREEGHETLFKPVLVVHSQDSEETPLKAAELEGEETDLKRFERPPSAVFSDVTASHAAKRVMFNSPMLRHSLKRSLDSADTTPKRASDKLEHRPPSQGDSKQNQGDNAQRQTSQENHDQSQRDNAQRQTSQGDNAQSQRDNAQRQTSQGDNGQSQRDNAQNQTMQQGLSGDGSCQQIRRKDSQTQTDSTGSHSGNRQGNIQSELPAQETEETDGLVQNRSICTEESGHSEAQGDEDRPRTSLRVSPISEESVPFLSPGNEYEQPPHGSDPTRVSDPP